MKLKVSLCILYLLPFAIISIFNQPAIDDFWSANVIRDHGRVGAVSFFYKTVSARFFSNFLMGFLNTLPYGEIWMFKMWPIIVILLLIGSFYFFYRSIFQTIFKANEVLLASLFFVVVYIANIRVLFEGLYWMSSTICYQVAVCVFVLGIGSVIRYLKSPSLPYAILSLSCCLLLPGTAESIAPVFFLVLAGMLYISIKQQSGVKFLLLCMGASLASMAFVALSQGNITRIQTDGLGYKQDIFYALFYSIRAVGFYNLIWLIIPLNIAALLLIFEPLKRIFKQIVLPVSIYYNPAFFILISYAACIIIYLPLTYFAAKEPFPRVTVMVFFVAAHLAVWAIGILLKKSKNISQFAAYLSGIKNCRTFGWIFFFAAAFSSRNFILVTRDLFQGNAYNYNLEANNRYEIIKAAKGDTCYVPEYVHWPAFIQYAKTENDNSNSFLRMNEYFKKTILYEKGMR